MEAFGLFLFMLSACYFGSMLESLSHESWHYDVTNPKLRQGIMASAMTITALFIFLSPFTAPSGAFINPSVSIMRWRLGQLSLENLFWYCIFQCLGGLCGVLTMRFFLGDIQRLPPVNDVITVPGSGIMWWEAALVEIFIGFLMISMVLFLSDYEKLEKKIPYFAALLVGLFVYFAGPVSGFGMNPARTLASALPSGIYTDFWIYMLCPTIGMLASAELYIRIKKKKPKVDFKLDGA